MTWSAVRDAADAPIAAIENVDSLVCRPFQLRTEEEQEIAPAAGF